MGEEHLPLLLEDHLFLLVLQGEGDVLQGQSLHFGAGLPILHQGDQGCPRGDHLMPGLLGQAVAVPGGTGAHVGHAAGGHNDPVGGDGLPVGETDPGDPGLIQFQALDLGPADGHLCLFQCEKQAVDHIGRPVRTRKNASPPLGLQGDA